MRSKVGVWLGSMPRDVTLTLLLQAVMILLALVLSWIQGRVGTLLVILCLIVSFLVCLLTSFVTSKSFVEPVSSALSRFEDKSDSVLRMMSSGLSDWMIDNQALIQIESSRSVKAAWVVSDDLPGDVNEGPFIGTVRQNLDRGVKYIYFVPDNPSSRGRAQALQNIHDNHPNIDVQYVGKDFFFLVKGFDFIIYNPQFDSGKGGRSGFMGLPISEDNGRWNVRMSNHMVETLVGYLNNMLEN